MGISNEIAERWQTARTWGGTIAGLAFAVVSALGIYDAFGSQFVPERYRNSLPKFYEVVQMTTSALSIGQWFYLLALPIIFALFEDVHRRRVQKNSITSPFLLVLNGIILLVLANQLDDRSQKPQSNPDPKLVAGAPQLDAQSQRISSLESSARELSESNSNLKSQMEEYFQYLSVKAKSARIAALAGSLPTESSSLENALCGDLSQEKPNPMGAYMIGRMGYNRSYNSTIESAQKETGIKTIVPSDLQQIRYKYITAFSSPITYRINEDILIARIDYRKSCESLKTNLADITKRVQEIETELKSKAAMYEIKNKL